MGDQRFMTRPTVVTSSFQRGRVLDEISGELGNLFGDWKRYIV